MLRLSENINACSHQDGIAIELAKMSLELSKNDEKLIDASAVSERKFSFIIKHKNKEIKRLDKKVKRLLHR